LICLACPAPSSDLWILHPPFTLSKRINTSERADGEIAGADLGEEGGGHLWGGLQMLHLPLNTREALSASHLIQAYL